MKNNALYVDVAEGVKYYLVERYKDTAQSKKVVLLLHGAGGGYVTWDMKIKDYNLMDYLAQKSFVVYAPDMRGFGESTITSGLDVRTETCADDLKAVVDFIKRRLGVSKIHLTGASYGSMVAATYAAKYQGDVEKLALMSPPYRDMSEQGKAILQAMLDLIDKGEGYYPNPTDIEALGCSFRSVDPEILSYCSNFASYCPNNPTGLWLDLVQGEDGKLPHDHYIPLITVPTLLIVSADDELCPAENAKLLYRDLGTDNKKIVVIPDVMHTSVLEREGHIPNMEALYDWFKD